MQLLVSLPHGNFCSLYRNADGQHKWYKFDDGDVCECNMENDEVGPFNIIITTPFNFV